MVHHDFSQTSIYRYLGGIPYFWATPYKLVEDGGTKTPAEWGSFVVSSILGLILETLDPHLSHVAISHLFEGEVLETVSTKDIRHK